MKKAIALVLALTLLILGAYLGFGLLARKNYEMALAELQANFPGQIESSYKQGLFTSNLDIKLDIPIPNTNPDSPDTISTKISQTIHHGPFVFSKQSQNTSLFIPVQLYAHGVLEFEPFMANEPPFVTELRHLATTEITVHAPLRGRSEVTFNGNSLQTTLPLATENFNLNWQGFTGNLSLEGTNLLTYDFEFQAPGLEIRSTGSGDGLVIEEITAHAKMRESSHNLSLGTFITAMKKCEITVGSKPEEKIAMNDLNIRITSDEKDALLRVEEEISLNHLQIADKTFGPGNLKISLTNLDAQSVAKLTEAYKALQADPGKSEVMALSILSGHAAALLAKSPEIRIENFSLASPEGAGLASGHIAFNGEGEVLMNPLFLLGRLSAEAKFSADEHFLAVQLKNILKENLCSQAPGPACDQEAALASSKQLQALIEQNILLFTGGKYTMTASFKNGQAILNGQPVPLSF